MPTYSIQMGQAAIVRCDAGNAPAFENAIYTGGGPIAPGDKLRYCSALVVPDINGGCVGMYHFPSGALTSPRLLGGVEQTRSIIRSLLERVVPDEVWIFWGRAYNLEGALGKPHYVPSENPDVQAITLVVHDVDPGIDVNPVLAGEDRLQKYCAWNGTAKAYFALDDEGEVPAPRRVRCVAQGEVAPPYANMVHLDELPPGRFDEACLLLANTERFPDIVPDEVPFDPRPI